jgi:hypothetical protein
MAYALDLSTFTVRRFAEITSTAQMLPSRQALADHISDVVPQLEKMGVLDVGALRKLLANSRGCTELAERLGVDESFLKLLNREVNAYRTKSMPLGKLEVLSDDELEALEGTGITSTKHLYDRCRAKDARTTLAADLGIDLVRLEDALRMSNIVRINGAGPSFARFFLSIGLSAPEDFCTVDPFEVANLYNESIADDPSQPSLRHQDIDYCKRFSEGLQTDIEW